MPIKGKTFEEWYLTIPKEKNDTSTYNLRRAYELAPEEELLNFANNKDAHLYSVYENSDGIYEFVKRKDHPTVDLELKWFNSNDPEAVEFRKHYTLDKSKDYYKYIPIKKDGGTIDYNTLDKIKLKIKDKPYELFIMKSEKEKEFGAKGVSELEEGEGFFFDYREDGNPDINFWMKDTDIPLTVVFVDDTDTVTKVYKGIPNDETFLSGLNVSYVLELSDKEDIKEGDEVDIEDNTFDDFPENGMFVLNSDGTIQFTLKGSERIFSRISSRVIIRKAKKAFKTKSETDYKALGRYIFRELDAQEERPAQYVDAK